MSECNEAARSAAARSATRAWAARVSASGPAGGAEPPGGGGGGGIRFGPRRRRVERSEVMVGEDTGQLVVPQRLEMPSRRHVLRPAVTLRERLIGDLTNDALDEAELSAFRRPRIRIEDEQLMTD